METKGATDENPLNQTLQDLLDRIHLNNASSSSAVQIQDRFTTNWTGPHDSRAMAFGKLMKNVMVIEDKETGALTWKCNEKHLDDNDRRKMNLVYDAVHRLRSSEDQHLHTGTGFGKEDWSIKTRGEKLRFVSLPLMGYDHLAEVLRSVVEEIEGGFQGQLSTAAALIVGIAQGGGIGMQDVAKLLKKDMAWVGVMKMHFRKMKAMVDEEAEDGWDWVVGLQKQVHLIGVIMPQTWDQFSCYFWAVVDVNIDQERSSTEVNRFVRGKIGI